tara:strand:- start:28428 stop:29378 length:951 start_codon:yes stop_codon:yes gene_type:complete
MKTKNILITGSSGFIGFHVSEFLLKKKINIIGLDNHNNYYDVSLKNKRLKILKKFKNFKFYKVDISKKKDLKKVFEKNKIDLVIHLAAQAGVRYSFINPNKYIDSNITGFTNTLELMKKNKIKKLVYASSSSVYGNCKKFPFRENFDLSPLNFYGQTKLFNEKMVKIYEENYNLKCIGLRFFTVYGPYGRPDMFIPKILNKIKSNKVINLFNAGKHSRDFTYVKDIAQLIGKIIIKFPKKEKVLNICSGERIKISKLISCIEKILNKKIKTKALPLQRGDMLDTHGSNKLIKKLYNYKKLTSIYKGLNETIKHDYK